MNSKFKSEDVNASEMKLKDKVTQTVASQIHSMMLVLLAPEHGLKGLDTP